MLLGLLELTQFKILRLNHFIEAINKMLQLGQLALDDDESVFKGGVHKRENQWGWGDRGWLRT